MRIRLPITICVSLATMMVGCGGSPEPTVPPRTDSTLASAAQLQAQGLSTHGTMTPSSLETESEFGPGDRPEATTPQEVTSDPPPMDHAARTVSGLYLQRSRAESLDRAMRGSVVWVEVGCCAGDGVDLAVLVAFGLQAAWNLGNDAPFLVWGADQRLAALTVNRLVELGMRRVILVTP